MVLDLLHLELGLPSPRGVGPPTKGHLKLKVHQPTMGPNLGGSVQRVGSVRLADAQGPETTTLSAAKYSRGMYFQLGIQGVLLPAEHDADVGGVKYGWTSKSR